ncbi:MAG: hypothetical protein D6723_11040 [Acidobacteria bacterium]|nr:MAG: hypothetical protein D6723_11040 [Acidobacteriota bacterium]
MRTRLVITALFLLLPIGPSSSAARSADPSIADGPRIIRPQETVSDVVVRGRRLEVLGRVEGSILVMGDDAIIEGRVDGDAIVLGGDLIQRRQGFIGGDVIVIGGRYQRAAEAPALHPSSKIIEIREYGQSLRESFRHPWRAILVPQITPAALGQRALGLLLYFLIALLMIALMPSPINRAIRMVRRHSGRLGLFGLLALSLLFIVLLVIVRFLPMALAVPMTLFVWLLWFGAYLLGSLAVHVVIGRWIQSRLVRSPTPSTIMALLYGMVVIAILSTLPIIGLMTLLVLVTLSLGVALRLPFRSPELGA